MCLHREQLRKTCLLVNPFCWSCTKSGHDSRLIYPLEYSQLKSNYSIDARFVYQWTAILKNEAMQRDRQPWNRRMRLLRYEKLDSQKNRYQSKIMGPYKEPWGTPKSNVIGTFFNSMLENGNQWNLEKFIRYSRKIVRFNSCRNCFWLDLKDCFWILVLIIDRWKEILMIFLKGIFRKTSASF